MEYIPEEKREGGQKDKQRLPSYFLRITYNLRKSTVTVNLPPSSSEGSVTVRR